MRVGAYGEKDTEIEERDKDGYTSTHHPTQLSRTTDTQVEKGIAREGEKLIPDFLFIFFFRTLSRSLSDRDVFSLFNIMLILRMRTFCITDKIQNE